MADLTVSVACLPQKSELCSGSNLPPLPHTTTPTVTTHSQLSQSHTHSSCNGTNTSTTSSSNYMHSEKAVVDVALSSALCKSVECEGNTKQYNGNLQPSVQNDLSVAVEFSKDLKDVNGRQILNCNESDDDHNDEYNHNEVYNHHHRCSVSQICQSHKHAPTIKLKSFDKCNGLTHHHTEIHSFKFKGLDWGSESTCRCQCSTKVDRDYVSCDEVETDICSPEQCCHNNCGVDTILTDLERISIHQLSYSSEPCTVSDDVINGVTYIVYESEKQMPDIMRLITKDLSEPYSIYTYRYFIHNWPKLCFLALCDTNCVGAIVCKLDLHKKMVRRGYIAMLAVDSEYRRRKIGSILVTKAIEAMIRDDCDEVVLETEITNQSALRLYENLGFVRDKRLFRYYLNGVDALRLKLWLR